jgi:transcriptional regulator with XRE-family HTH domain
MRRILGITQEKLAEDANLSSQAINDIEGCRMWVSDKTICKLAQALHIDFHQLFTPLYRTKGTGSGRYKPK